MSLIEDNHHPLIYLDERLRPLCPLRSPLFVPRASSVGQLLLVLGHRGKDNVGSEEAMKQQI
jgi:hypothetical protein